MIPPRVPPPDVDTEIKSFLSEGEGWSLGEEVATLPATPDTEGGVTGDGGYAARLLRAPS